MLRVGAALADAAAGQAVAKAFERCNQQLAKHRPPPNATPLVQITACAAGGAAAVPPGLGELQPGGAGADISGRTGPYRTKETILSQKTRLKAEHPGIDLGQLDERIKDLLGLVAAFWAGRAMRPYTIEFYKTSAHNSVVGTLTYSARYRKYLYTVYVDNTASFSYRRFITTSADDDRKAAFDQAVALALQGAWNSVYNGHYVGLPDAEEKMGKMPAGIETVEELFESLEREGAS